MVFRNVQKGKNMVENGSVVDLWIGHTFESVYGITFIVKI